MLLFSAALLIPAVVGAYYNESLMQVTSYVAAAFIAFTIGSILDYSTEMGELQTRDAMIATVAGWFTAVIIGASPFLLHTSMINAIFEASAGFTTTGISLLENPESMPKSLIFWRSMIQWVGGIGILTFFLAVIRESGGVTRGLFTAESHKTESGSIRPSLLKSLVTMVKVYTVLSITIFLVYLGLGMSAFEAFVHSFSSLSTGGFSSHSDSIAYFNSHAITTFTALVMFFGGTNFVLLFDAVKGKISSLTGNSEFRLYTLIVVLATIPFFTELQSGGMTSTDALVHGLFQASSVVSTTGFSTVTIGALSTFVQSMVIVLMIVGCSVGSTGGGLKVFRVLVLARQAAADIRKYSLPRSAISKAVVDGEIIKDKTVHTIFALFFVWMTVITLMTLSTVLLEDFTFIQALSGAASTTGNVGPVYAGTGELMAMSPITKAVWILGMLAGRLEMIPFLVIFNREIFQN